MSTEKLIGIKNSVKDLARERPGYRSVAVVRDAAKGDRVYVDIEPDADVHEFDDIAGLHDGVTVVVRRVSGSVRADAQLRPAGLE
ncbi:hypothetical protein GIW81_08430 [Hyphomicrobium sp. xq]|uniref:Uncharacterized protein n=1 Tax=Hyphomicrobium album TaxID=2665159 RepID=A0A6I3KIY2_9HYPH|nr:hypothetical protein [Hyphomicrobium album]MTD94359.1 hypothetical protein [Hyphomicrobium album]